ncbi:MAG TPA: site-specific integrase [Casimicrobiaceae bacterium]|nr:site-specific integrase [Casimicrobiaceae bacterium]
MGEKPRRTWNDAVVRWLKEKSHKATVKGDVNLLRWLDPFLSGQDLATITRATLDGIAELPEHLADMVAFSLGTGLRAANVTGLQWNQVDLARQLAWMALVRKQVGKHSTYVFSFRRRPIKQVSSKAWYRALKRAGIQDFRWHDLRHCWASWHVQNGTPLFALQELGGWQSPGMVRRYAHLAADHLAPYAERLCAVRAVAAEDNGTNTAQGGKQVRNH